MLVPNYARRRRRSARNRAIRRVLGRPVVVLAFIVFALAVVHPAHGTGVNVCLWHGMTDMACPGCGMTRSVSCAVRGMWTESWGYHPFGIVITMLLASVALFAVMPGANRRAVMRRLLQRSAIVNKLYMLTVATFVSFGVARVVAGLL